MHLRITHTYDDMMECCVFCRFEAFIIPVLMQLIDSLLIGPQLYDIIAIFL